MSLYDPAQLTNIKSFFSGVDDNVLRVDSPKIETACEVVAQLTGIVAQSKKAMSFKFQILESTDPNHLKGINYEWLHYPGNYADSAQQKLQELMLALLGFDLVDVKARPALDKLLMPTKEDPNRLEKYFASAIADKKIENAKFRISAVMKDDGKYPKISFSKF